MKRPVVLAAILALLAGTACHANRPVWSATPGDSRTPGTIAGILKTPGGEPVAGRRVSAVGIETAQRYSAETNVNGGFSIHVPPGKYRLEPELREGETVVRDPGVINVNKSDTDANRDIVIRP
jgi:Carboxypeptidase regulatory-like domain